MDLRHGHRLHTYHAWFLVRSHIPNICLPFTDKSSCLLIVLLYDRAIYKVMGTGLFWALLLAVTVVGMIPHFAAKAFREYFTPSDIQIAREMEKSQDTHDATHPEVQMSSVSRA